MAANAATSIGTLIILAVGKTESASTLASRPVSRCLTYIPTSPSNPASRDSIPSLQHEVMKWGTLGCTVSR